MTHCWHVISGVVLDSIPRQTQVQCCNCGTTAYRTYRLEHPVGHGDYAPLVESDQFVIGHPKDQECVPIDKA